MPLPAIGRIRSASLDAARPWWPAFARDPLPSRRGNGKPALQDPSVEAHALGINLSLAQAKEVAFLRNWDLLAAKANVDQSIGQEIVTHEFPNPTFSWSTQKVNVDNQPAGAPGANTLWDRNYDTIFAINQLLEVNKRSKRQASAAAGREAAVASFEDAHRTLDLAVAKAYIAALLAQANVRILHQTAESLQHEAKIADTRLNAGDLSKSDKAQIEIAASRAELDAESAQSLAVSSRIAVEILLGEKKPNGAWMMTEDLGDLATAGDVRGPTAPRPDLVAAQATLRKAEWDWRLQRAMQVPDPTILVQYEHEPFDQPNTIGVGISLPLPIWNQNGGNIRAAAAPRDQASAQVGKIETQVASDISSAQVAYDEALTRWHKYQKDISPRAAEVLKSVSYAYQKGGAALLDLLEAERSDNDIRLATAQAMADSATAAATLANVRNVISSSPGNPRSPTQRSIMRYLILSSLACGLLAACHSEKQADNPPVEPKVEGDKITFAADAPQKASFTSEAAKAIEQSIIHLTGRLVWDDRTTVKVFCSVAGRVERIPVNLRDMVGAGDTLAFMNSPDFGQAQADASKADADLKLSERTLTRSRDLFEHGAAAQKDVEAAEDDYENKKAELQRSLARLKLYGVEIGASVDGMFPLKAPLGGRVVEKNINPGQEVRPDQMLANDPNIIKPLFVISDPKRLAVLLDVTELDTAHLRPGQQLLVRSRAYPDEAFDGRLEVVGDSLDPLTRTVNVRGYVDNPDGLLKAEMYVGVDIVSVAEESKPVAANDPSPAATGDKPLRLTLPAGQWKSQSARSSPRAISTMSLSRNRRGITNASRSSSAPNTMAVSASPTASPQASASSPKAVCSSRPWPKPARKNGWERSRPTRCATARSCSPCWRFTSSRAYRLSSGCRSRPTPM